MKFRQLVWLGLAALLPGCAYSPPANETLPVPNPDTHISSAYGEPSGGDEIVASIAGDSITMRELQAPLMEGYGLNDLLLLVQRDLARQALAKEHLILTPQDIQNERNITGQELARATRRITDMAGSSTQPDEDADLSPQALDDLLNQIITREHLTKPEFQIILETNACLRKIIGPEVAAKITEDAVRHQFNAEYGEKVKIHYIVCRNQSQMADIRRDLAAGKSFEDVARARSIDRATASSGGELPAFTRQDNRFPDELKELAFATPVGTISDSLQLGDYFYTIKVIALLPPAHARFEDYRRVIRKDLLEQTIQAAMRAMRQRLANTAMTSLSVKDPLLLKQWQARMDVANNAIHDREKIRQQLDKEHAPATTLPSMTGAAGPNPFAVPAATRPAPATMPAAH